MNILRFLTLLAVAALLLLLLVKLAQAGFWGLNLIHQMLR